VRVWFYVSGPARAPILATQLTYTTNGKCILHVLVAHRFFNIVKILNTKFQHTSF
jgi:BarA-like signal transduction histidine kinase